MASAITSREMYSIFSSDANDDNPAGSLQRSGGRHISKTITLSANNTSASENIFQITGSVYVSALHALISDATTLTNCTAVHFDLWDGSTSVDITLAPGQALSGLPVGTFMIKDEDVSSNLTVIDISSQCQVTEPTAKEIGLSFVVSQKNATNTYIRFNYTTTDTPINAQIEVHMHYAIIDGGTITAV